jgi:hypothetical protein
LSSIKFWLFINYLGKYYILWNSLLLTLWSWALLERSPVVRTLDSFPAFYGTRRFNTKFTRALHLSLSWARPIQSTSTHPSSTRCGINYRENNLKLVLFRTMCLVYHESIVIRSSHP